MDIDDEDQHICLSCHNIFTGLNSYINHRKNECPNRKQNRPAKEKVDFVDLPVASVSHDGAQSSDSAHQQALQAIDILNQITNDKQTQPTHQSATEQQETVADAFISQNDSVPNASVANSVVSLPMDINCTPSLVNSALSPSSNRIVDPNMVLYEGEKHLADFFTSLELQSRNTNADVGKSADKGLEIESAAADFLSMNQSSADIDSTLRIANILNDLGFSSESDDDLNNYDCDVNFSDESGDESRPPSGYTGGKWKPGSQPASHQNNRQTWKASANAPPENHTRGKWKPGSTPEQHRGGKWRPSSSPPPENHTRGKWKPGRGPPEGYGGGKWKPTADESDSENEKAHEDAENVNSHDQEETTSAINGSEVVNELHMESKSRRDSDENVAKTGVDSVTKKSEEQMLIEPTFHCETCDRTLLTEKSYESHLKTRLHAKRTKEKDNPTEKIVIASPRENSEEIDCPICIRTFNNKYNFARHLVSVVHKEAARDQGRDLMLVEKYQLLVSRLSPYQCKVCAFYCNNSEDLEIHLNTSEHASKVLSITGPLLCVRCAFNTEQNKEMIQHMKSKEHIDTVQKSKRPCVIKEQRYRIRCKLCDQLFISASRLFGHMRRYHSIKVLDKCKSTKCPHCGQEFKSVFAMSLHVRRKHTTERPFKCNFCQVAFIDSYSLKLHEKTRKHLNAVTGNPEQQEQQETRKRGRPPSMGKCRGGVFKCDHCNFKTKKYGDLRPHYMNAHVNQMYRCETCGTAYCFEKNLAKHMKSVTHKKAVQQATLMSAEKPLSCMVCFKKFYNPKQLRLHEYTHQVNESAVAQKGQVKVSQPKLTSRFREFLNKLPKGYKRATCPECNKVVSRQNLLPHLRLHENDSIFQCPMCGHSYVSMQSLRKHMKKHLGIKDYRCKVCGKEFYKASSYVVHVMRHDKNMPKSFKCSHCDSCFYRHWELTRHLKIHTGKNIKCEFAGCRLVFANMSELRIHERTHTGEKPYLCDECGYSGKTQQQLTRHRRTHTGERNFSCEYCPYKGSNSTHLRRHMRIHIGSKPYKCPYCEYRCNTHENIRKHITKTKKHIGLKIYPCKMCSFGSNDIKEFKEHMLQVHPECVGSDTHIVSAFAGLYDSQNDPRKVPEGSQALPVKEKMDRKAPPPINVSMAIPLATKSLPTFTNIIYEDHAYSNEDEIMQQLLKVEPVTIEIVDNNQQGWNVSEILPNCSVPQHAAEVTIYPL